MTTIILYFIVSGGYCVYLYIQNKTNVKLKTKIMGKFEYETGDIKFKGAFNIYQARNGAIMLLMGTKISALTYSQINELNIDCYELEDFNHDDFHKYYQSGSENVL